MTSLYIGVGLLVLAIVLLFHQAVRPRTTQEKLESAIAELENRQRVIGNVLKELERKE